MLARAAHAANTITHRGTHTHTHVHREREGEANTDIVEMQIKLTERQTKKRSTNKRTPGRKEAPKNQTELEVGKQKERVRVGEWEIWRGRGEKRRQRDIGSKMGGTTGQCQVKFFVNLQELRSVCG